MAQGFTSRVPIPVTVSNGGTGTTSLTDHSVLVGSGTAAITAVSVGSDGQVLLGATGADPAFGTITSTGGTIIFTAGVNSLNMDVVGGGLNWTEVTGTSQAIAVENGYIANNAGLVTLTLPTTAAIGDTVKILGKGAGLYKIAQNASQTIRYVSSSTTTGIGGSLTAIEQYATLELICITANTDFIVSSSQGSFTVV